MMMNEIMSLIVSAYLNIKDKGNNDIMWTILPDNNETIVPIITPSPAPLM